MHLADGEYAVHLILLHVMKLIGSDAGGVDQGAEEVNSEGKREPLELADCNRRGISLFLSGLTTAPSRPLQAWFYVARLTAMPHLFESRIREMAVNLTRVWEQEN